MGINRAVHQNCLGVVDQSFAFFFFNYKLSIKFSFYTENLVESNLYISTVADLDDLKPRHASSMHPARNPRLSLGA